MDGKRGLQVYTNTAFSREPSAFSLAFSASWLPRPDRAAQPVKPKRRRRVVPAAQIVVDVLQGHDFSQAVNSLE
jgi:hypothetical protein